jgi:hypothetical protein
VCRKSKPFVGRFACRDLREGRFDVLAFERSGHGNISPCGGTSNADWLESIVRLIADANAANACGKPALAGPVSGRRPGMSQYGAVRRTCSRLSGHRCSCGPDTMGGSRILLAHGGLRWELELSANSIRQIGRLRHTSTMVGHGFAERRQLNRSCARATPFTSSTVQDASYDVLRAVRFHAGMLAASRLGSPSSASTSRTSASRAALRISRILVAEAMRCYNGLK